MEHILLVPCLRKLFILKIFFHKNSLILCHNSRHLKISSKTQSQRKAMNYLTLMCTQYNHTPAPQHIIQKKNVTLSEVTTKSRCDTILQIHINTLTCIHIHINLYINIKHVSIRASSCTNVSVEGVESIENTNIKAVTQQNKK